MSLSLRVTHSTFLSPRKMMMIIIICIAEIACFVKSVSLKLGGFRAGGTLGTSGLGSTGAGVATLPEPRAVSHQCLRFWLSHGLRSTPVHVGIYVQRRKIYSALKENVISWIDASCEYKINVPQRVFVHGCFDVTSQ